MWGRIRDTVDAACSPAHTEPTIAPCMARWTIRRIVCALRGDGPSIASPEWAALRAAESELQRTVVYLQFRRQDESNSRSSGGADDPRRYLVDGRPVGQIVRAATSPVRHAERRWRFEFEFEHGESVDAPSEFSQDFISEAAS